MEHWLTERSTIYTLIAASQGRGELGDTDTLSESIEAAYRVRSREKVLQLTQQAFYTVLELTLLSKFDLRGEETMVALQQRLAKDMIPHDVPHEKDITPLLDIFRCNSSGMNACWYRYLLCDVLSADAFSQCKYQYERDASSMSDMRIWMRQGLLEQGAELQIETLTSKYDTQSLEPLFRLYRLNS